MEFPYVPVLYNWTDFFPRDFVIGLIVKYPPGTPEGDDLYDQSGDAPPFDLNYDFAEFETIKQLPNYEVAHSIYIGTYFCNKDRTVFYRLKDLKDIRQNRNLVNHFLAEEDKRMWDDYKPSIFYMPIGFKYEISEDRSYESIKCMPPIQEIVLDFLDRIKNPNHTKYRSIYSPALIDGKITMDDLHAMASNDCSQVGRCEDCFTTGPLRFAPACVDEHLYGIQCCVKKICYVCQRKCICGTLNYIVCTDYYDTFECYKCHKHNECSVLFYGDLKLTCQRHCDQEHYVSPVVVLGQSYE